MTLKKAGEPIEVPKQEVPSIPDGAFDYAKEQQRIAEALSGADLASVDSNEPHTIKLETTEIIDEKILKEDAPAVFSDPEEDGGHTVHPKEFYNNIAGGMAPAVEVSKKGFSGNDTARQLNDLTGKEKTFNSEEERTNYVSKQLAKPASQQDLRHLDESLIMNLPQIKAADMKLVDALNPRPKDPNIRFKWVNFKNAVQGNLYKYLALGFQTATVEDIDQDKTPTDPSMIDGTQIKYYDVVLLKVGIMRLMELYKSNIIRSVMRLGRVKEKGIAEANRQFRSDISNTPGAAKYFNDFTARHGHAPVEFEVVSN